MIAAAQAEAERIAAEKAEAERIARSEKKTQIRITSGIGVREYYASLGYHLEHPYMVKDL